MVSGRTLQTDNTEEDFARIRDEHGEEEEQRERRNLLVSFSFLQRDGAGTQVVPLLQVENVAT